MDAQTAVNILLAAICLLNFRNIWVLHKNFTYLKRRQNQKNDIELLKILMAMGDNQKKEEAK